MLAGDHFKDDPQIARAERQAAQIVKICNRLLADPKAAPEARRFAERAKRSASDVVMLARSMTCGDPRWSWHERAEITVWRKLADAQLAAEIAAIRYLEPVTRHGVRMEPGRDTSAATRANKINRAERHADTLSDLVKITSVYDRDPMKTKRPIRKASGAIHQGNLAKEYLARKTRPALKRDSVLDVIRAGIASGALK